jgi:hypothetical protein
MLLLMVPEDWMALATPHAPFIIARWSLEVSP